MCCMRFKPWAKQTRGFKYLKLISKVLTAVCSYYVNCPVVEVTIFAHVLRSKFVLNFTVEICYRYVREHFCTLLPVGQKFEQFKIVSGRK